MDLAVTLIDSQVQQAASASLDCMAFKAVMEDPKFLADAKKSKLNINHVTWQQIEKTIQKMFSMSKQMKEDLRIITGIKKKKS